MMSGYDHMLSLVSGNPRAGDKTDRVVSIGDVGAGKRLVLYPGRLRYHEILAGAGSDSGNGCYYLPYFPATGAAGMTGWKAVQFVWKLWRLLDGCNRVDLFFMSPTLDWPAVYTAGVLGRLKGVPSVLRDFSFYDDAAGRRRRLLQSLCLSSDDSGCGGAKPVIASTPRPLAFDQAFYRQARKNKAVPHVIVVGNSENERMTALARRASEMVKQKYPRTEFVTAAMMEGGISVAGPADGAISRRIIAGEDDMRALYAESDTVALLSPGGINGLFVARARAAGFPIIVNGFGLADPSPSSSRPIVIPRDSYSALAEAVIRLVDDDAYYRSFASA
jgi:hypothetical protein